MNTTIHSLWISGPLQPINWLTIRSFISQRHDFVLHAYNHVELYDQLLRTPWGSDLDDLGALSIRDAREIMPESEVYFYKKMLGGNPNFKFGGIAERLKAEMLYQLGGWHVDLDVTCLKSFDQMPVVIKKGRAIGPSTVVQPLLESYVLRPHEKGVVGNIIMAPRHSELARRYVEHTKTIDENNQHWEKSFMGLNQIVFDLQLQNFIVSKEILGDDSHPYWMDFTKKGPIPGEKLHAIHWCNAMQVGYEAGSYLDQLLLRYAVG